MWWVLLSSLASLNLIDASSDVFTRIYDHSMWGGGSGPGSLISRTVEYRAFLSTYLSELQTNASTPLRILDVGSGDWQSTHLINWTGYNYTGIDCVHSVIQDCHKYAQPHIHFYQHDILIQPWIYPVDVVILKDVLQHWPTHDIIRVVTNLRMISRWLIVTNCAGYIDMNISLGGFRPLSYLHDPLVSFNPELKLTFSTKQTSVIRGLYE